MKIILLGESNTGKTSLMKRYIHGIFQLNNNTKTTIGASYQSVNISTITSIEPMQRLLRVGIWDTAGAERFSSLTRHYYRESNLAIICFDLMDTKNFFKLNKWIEELTQIEPECMLVLCGTKCDNEDDEDYKDQEDSTLTNSSHMINRKLKRVPQSYIEQVMTEWDIEFYLETSSKTGVNVDDLFTRSVQVWYDHKKGRMQHKEVMNLRKKSKLLSPEQKSLLGGLAGGGCYCGI
jgi:small GTP-binding protein